MSEPSASPSSSSGPSGTPDDDPDSVRPGFAPGRARPLAALIVLIVALVPVAIGLTIGGGSGSPRRAAARTTPVLLTPVGRLVQPPLARLLPRPAPGALVALITRQTVMRAAPGGRVIARVALRTPFGSPQTMWVQRRSGRWLGVVSVLAGNHRLGWIPLRVASLSHDRWQLRVNVRARRLTVAHHGHTVKTYTVAVGAAQSPTPTGRFAVTDRLRTGDPSGPYGCCILALSAVVPHAIAGWTGGNRIAIHSTPDTTSIGQPDSHGCIRLTLAEGRWLIAHIPLGTPTIVSS